MKKSTIAILVASAFAAPAAFAADAISTFFGTTANSLNTGGTGGNTTVGNANGITAINGSSIRVSGPTLINTTGSSATTIGSATSATTVSGTLRVNGASTTAGITNTGNIATGTLNTTGAATLNSAAVTTNATVGGTLGVTGATTMAGISNTGGLTQNGGTSLNGATTITGATIVNGTTTLNGATRINGALNMNGNLLNNLAAGVAGSDAVNLNQLNNAIAASNPLITGTSTVGSGQAVTGLRVANTGGTGSNVDANGKITTGTVSQPSASLTVTNGVGNTHGFVVNETQATISGGVNSTSLTLNDSGATFSNAASGAPVKVTGVANGTSAYDAVNYQQLQQLRSDNNAQFKQQAAGIAGVTAMTNIPQVEQNKTFSFGMGLGGYQSQGAIAFGGSYRAAPNAVLKASFSTGLSSDGGKTPTYGVGGAISW